MAISHHALICLLLGMPFPPFKAFMAPARPHSVPLIPPLVDRRSRASFPSIVECGIPQDLDSLVQALLYGGADMMCRTH
jgi:hypothetical protein